jgi:hypothetical protein
MESAVFTILYNNMPGRPADQEPEGGRNDTVRQVLRRAFDRRARDGGLVQLAVSRPRSSKRRGVRLSSERRNPIGDGAHMIHEAFLGQEHGGDQDLQTPGHREGTLKTQPSAIATADSKPRHHPLRPPGSVPC